MDHGPPGPRGQGRSPAPASSSQPCTCFEREARNCVSTVVFQMSGNVQHLVQGHVVSVRLAQAKVCGKTLRSFEEATAWFSRRVSGS